MRAARRVGGRARRGAAGVRAAPPPAAAGGRRRLLPAGPSCIGCAASSRRPRRRTTRPAVGTRAPARPGAAPAGRRARSMPRRRRSVARRTRRRTASRGRGCFPRSSRSCLPPVTSARHAPPRIELSEIADDLDAPLLTRVAAHAAGAVLLLEGDARARSARCAMRGRRGRSSRCPTKPRGSGCSSDSRADSSGTRTPR